jgi:hypothetical protein
MQKEVYPIESETQPAQTEPSLSISKLFDAVKIRIHIASSRFSYSSGSPMTERQTIIHNLDTNPNMRISDIQAELKRRSDIARGSDIPPTGPELPPSA